jgi:hypothetical protein
MDSGIQGSACDLGAASSGSDLEENMDDDSLNRWDLLPNRRYFLFLLLSSICPGDFLWSHLFLMSLQWTSD